MTGFLAYSLSGHDKGKVYLIIKEEADYVYVSDGSVRPLDKLKRKNKKHIQIIKCAGRRANTESMTNEEIKHFIKVWIAGVHA